MRLRLPLGALLATVLVVPTTVVLPTVTVGRDAPRPVPPGLATLALAGVDRAALRSEPVPAVLARHLAEEGADGPVARRRALAAPAVLTARTPTADYAMVGVTWLPDPRPVDLVVTVRARTDGRWSRWRELEQLADRASGEELASSTRMATAPLWVGPSDGVQVRVDVVSGTVPGGLRVDLVDPGSSPADDDVAASPPSSSAAAAAAMPDIVTRAEWGADESLRDQHLEMSRTVKAAFVHHTAGSNGYTAAEAPAVVRGLLAYSTQSMGYADIPYNFLVDKFGRIYEGRAGSITSPVRQAATGGFNPDTMSVSALGNFVSTAAPDAMVRSISEIVAYRLSAYHRNPFGRKTLVAQDGSSRYSAGQRATFRVISGHRDAGYTACPGDRLYERLPQIRRQVKRLMGAGFVEPSVATPASEYGGPDAFLVQSRVLTPTSWRLTVERACDDRTVRTLTGTADPDQPLAVTWRGRNDAGRPVPAGRYVLTLTGGSDSSTAVAWSGGVQVQVGSAAPRPTVAALPASPAGRYVPLTPTRLMTTSTGFGIDAPVLLGAGGRVTVPVLGRAGVPARGVSAVAVSVQGACASRATALSVGPDGVRGALAPAVAVDSGDTARGLAVSALGSSGGLTVRNERGAVSAALVVVGYWTTGTGGDGYLPVVPRAVPGTARGLDVGTGPVSVTVAGTVGVPSDATSVVLNVRRLAGGDADEVWLWPTGADRPTVGLLRRGTGAPTLQRVVVPLGRGGQVTVAASGSAAVRLDVVGYLADGGGSLHPVDPTRLTTPGLRLAGGTSTRVPVAGVAGVPSYAEAVVLQLSAAGAAAPTTLAVYPAGSTPPAADDLVVPRRTGRTNLVVVPLGTDGRVRVDSADAAVDVGLTVVGWIG